MVMINPQKPTNDNSLLDAENPQNPTDSKTFVIAGDFTGSGFQNVLMIQQTGETVCCWMIDKEGHASLQSAVHHPQAWAPVSMSDQNAVGKQEFMVKHDNGSLLSSIIIERQTNDCQIKIDLKSFFGEGTEPGYDLNPEFEKNKPDQDSKSPEPIENPSY